MDTSTIVFRADGDAKIGMGHFMRTLALAEMLHEKFDCIYAVRNATENQKIEIEKVCKHRIDLPEDDTHFSIFLNNLKGNEIVVLDNYYFTAEYQQQIKSLGCKLVCIDDTYDRHYVADVVINHAEGIDPLVFSIEKYTRLALGFKYALLRKEYLSDNRDEQKQYSFFIMMGGADPYNLVYKFSDMINNLNPDLPVAVVLGSGCSNPDSFNTFENVVPFRNLYPKEILKIMQRSRIGILPASTVAIEACAARLPFICGYFVDNQKEIYAGIQRESLALCVGEFSKINSLRLIDAIERMNNPLFFNKVMQNQKKVLDKKSKERFLKLFQEL